MGTIPSQIIEQVAAANDIVEVIGTYFPLKRAGANFRALCPFHQEKTPSFHVNPARQSFHCFGCGVGGSVFRFVMDYEHVDFPAAVRRLAARAGIPVIEERGGTASDDRQHEVRRTLLKLHAEAAEWFHENLLTKASGAPARQYLKQRGIGSAVVKSWQLGFAPESWDAFSTWARERGYSHRELIASGLVSVREGEQNQTSNLKPQTSFYDRFRARLMFPICNDVGEVIAFSGRILQGDAAKYLNSPETPLFRKGSVLFGLHKTKRGLIEAGCAIVCEGQLDLITVFEAGLTNVVAPQGTAFTEGQARILKRFVNEVVLCFDADTAGQKAAERSLEPLLQNDLVVRVAEMPAGEDPDSLIRKEGAENFHARVSAARDFFDFWIEHEAAKKDLTSLSAKMEVAEELGKTAARVNDPLMRREVATKIASRLAISVSEFLSSLPIPRSQPQSSAAMINITPEEWRKIDFLCLLALRSAVCREFLLSQNWRAIAGIIPGMDPLIRILEADFNPDDPASVATFTSSLVPEEQPFMASLLARKFPAEPDKLVTLWWHGLQNHAIKRELQAAESRLKLPQLSAGEVVALQKQIVDLRTQLDDFSRFSPTHVLDS